MCLRILIKRGRTGWVLRYVPKAPALTDPPTDLLTFIKQRRRWTNGSLLSSFNVVFRGCEVRHTNHGVLRKGMFYSIFVYMMINLFFNVIFVATLFSGFSIFLRKVLENTDPNCAVIYKNPAYMMEIIYVCLLMFYALLCITKPIEHSRVIFTLIVVIFAFFMMITTVFAFVYLLREGLWTYTGFFFVFVGFCYYLVPPILRIRQFNVCKYFIGSLFNILLAPTYITIILTYSIANLHDITWGN